MEVIVFREITLDEARVAQIYGLTGSEGITLLPLDVGFRILVEQEERYHGALIGSTALGQAWRILTQCRFASSEESRKDLAKVLRKLHYYARTIHDGGLEAQEATAKYLSALAHRRAKGPPAPLETHVEEALAYELFGRLVETFGDPRTIDARHLLAVMDIARTLGRAAFNTAEMEELANKSSAEKFRATLEGGAFSASSSASARLRCLLDGLPVHRVRRWKGLTRIETSGALGTNVCRVAYEWARRHLSDTAGLPTEQALSFTDNAKRAVLVAKRIEASYPGLYCEIDTSAYQLQLSSNYCRRVDVHPPYASRQVLHDPALRVYYAPRHFREKARSCSPPELAAVVRVSSGCTPIAFLEFNGETTRATVRHMHSDARDDYMAQASCNNLADLRCVLAAVSTKDGVMIVQDVPPIGISDRRAPVEQYFGRFGRIVFWRPQGTLLPDLGHEPRFCFYYPSGDSWEGAEADPTNTATPLGRFLFDGRAPAIACVPRYFEGVLANVGGASVDKWQQGVTVFQVLTESSENLAQVRDAAVAFHALFIRGMFSQGSTVYDSVDFAQYIAEKTREIVQ